MCVFMVLRQPSHGASGVHLDRLDDLVQVVGHLHGAVGEVARRTPRLPSTSSNVFWSAVWYATVAVGSFSWWPVRMHDDALVRRRSRPPARSFRAPATLAADAGSQPRPPAPTFALASRISWSVASRTTPPQRSSARSAFGRFTGRLISMALAIVSARGSLASSAAIVAVDLGLVRPAAVPAQAVLLVELIERVGPGRVDDGQPRRPVDQAQLRQLDERLAERADVAEVAARHDDPVRHLPAAAPPARGT